MTMLWFERQVIDTLGSADGDKQRAVASYVDGTLRLMPESIRAGIVAESLLLGSWPRLQQVFGRYEPHSLERRIARWESSPIAPIRQYVRALRALVLFAEYEMAGDD
jgi:hypothetical protein